MTASTEVSGRACETKDQGFCRFASHVTQQLLSGLITINLIICGHPYTVAFIALY